MIRVLIVVEAILIASVLVMGVAFFFFHRHNKAQLKRLAELRAADSDPELVDELADDQYETGHNTACSLVLLLVLTAAALAGGVLLGALAMSSP